MNPKVGHVVVGGFDLCRLCQLLQVALYGGGRRLEHRLMLASVVGGDAAFTLEPVE